MDVEDVEDVLHGQLLGQLARVVKAALDEEVGEVNSLCGIETNSKHISRIVDHVAGQPQSEETTRVLDFANFSEDFLANRLDVIAQLLVIEPMAGLAILAAVTHRFAPKQNKGAKAEVKSGRWLDR